MTATTAVTVADQIVDAHQAMTARRAEAAGSEVGRFMGAPINLVLRAADLKGLDGAIREQWNELLRDGRAVRIFAKTGL